jgi:iron complex outermembrane receptor protein
MKNGLIALIISIIIISFPIFGQSINKTDLSVTGIQIKRLNNGEKISLNISVFVKNSGTQSVETPFTTTLFYHLNDRENWKILKSWDCANLLSKKEKRFDSVFVFKKKGIIYFKAVVDYNNRIKESSENNNTYETIFKIGLRQENIPQNLEITVSAPRFEIPLKENPASTSVVGKDTLDNMPKSIGAEEALSFVPGVKVENQADGERVHLYIRGQGILSERGIRGIKIINDGLPLNDPSGFVSDLYDIDWATVSRIEVVRGPAASLYGSGGAGGIINIITQNGGKKGFNGNGLFSLGSYSFGKALLNIGGTNGNLNYRLSVSKNRGNGYREHTKFHSNNIYGKFNWKPNSSVELTGILSWTDFYNDNAEGLNLDWLKEDRRMANPDALIFNEYQETKRATTGLVGKIKITQNQEFNFAAYYRKTRYEESVPSSVDHRCYNTPGLTLQYRIKTEGGLFNNYLIIGADLEWQKIDEYRHPNLGKAIEGSEILSDQSIYQKNTGLYLIDRVELNSKWGIVLSVRHDNIYNELEDYLKDNGINLSGNADFRKNTARVGISWNPKMGFGIYANWGMGFLPPSTEELSNNPDSLGGFNSHLKPATSYGEEIGARGYFGKSLYYDFSIFYVHTDNDFGRYRISSRPLETFYRNIGSTKKYGFETFFAWYPIDNLRIQTAYTYSDFKYISFETDGGYISGTFLPNSPKHRVVSDIQYRVGKLILGAGVNAQSRSFVNAENEVWIEGYTLINLRISYNLSNKMELMIYGKNIFNKEYIAFTEPDPDGNSYQPAPTREIFASIKFKF